MRRAARPGGVPTADQTPQPLARWCHASSFPDRARAAGSVQAVAALYPGA
jgi:hypothetical protein